MYVQIWGKKQRWSRSPTGTVLNLLSMDLGGTDNKKTQDFQPKALTGRGQENVFMI